MEKEKNNAVEKVENITEEKTNNPKKSAYSTENPTKKKTNTTKTTKKLTPKEVKNQNKKEKEAQMREKRIEDAKLKRQKREEKEALKREKRLRKEKAKKAKQDILKKRKEEYRLEKLRKKEERMARRDMIKHESFEERQKRISAEKQAKAKAKESKRNAKLKAREQKNAIRRQKIADRRALKEQNRRLRLENKREKRSRGLGGWLAAVIALGSTTLVLATLFTLNMLTDFGNQTMDAGNVAETYYDLVDYVSNMDVNMSKILVSNDTRQQQKLLSELSTQASLAADDITRLPIKDENKYYTTKYINQVADYSKYLNNRLIDGYSLSESDRENLNSLYNINKVLKEELSGLTSNMGSEFDFNTIFNDHDDNLFLSKFSELEKGAVDYPKLIYDGPFSDSLKTDSPKGLSGEEITTNLAEQTFKQVFASYGVDMVETVGETQGKIPCYSIRGEVDGDEVYAQISKTGGHVIMFSSYGECTQGKYSLEQCTAFADDFIQSLGIENMEAVWATENQTTVYINYCYQQNGVIVYTDMIKVTVCKERGVVSGFDANAYYYNHTERDIAEPNISREKAVNSLSSDLQVLSVRLAVIPKGEEKEILAYEVYGVKDQATYYIYVDALTGKETQIFLVVETTDGNLLI